MTMREFWCLYDAKVGEPKHFGLKESELDRLSQVLDEAKAAEARGEKWQPQLDN